MTAPVGDHTQLINTLIHRHCGKDRGRPDAGLVPAPLQ